MANLFGKLLLLLIFGPLILVILAHWAIVLFMVVLPWILATAAIAGTKLFLPWIILAIFITGAIASIVLAFTLKHRLPLVPRTSFSSHGGARPNAVRRPRGPRGKE